jgi:dienelactone hydrolase
MLYEHHTGTPTHQLMLARWAWQSAVLGLSVEWGAVHTDRAGSSLTRTSLARSSRAQSLYGAADDWATAEDVYRMAQRLEELGKTFVLTVYRGTGHAFTLPDGGAYNPNAAENAWEQSIAFLDRYLRP